MFALRCLAVSMIAGLIACSAAPVEETIDRRNNSSDDDKSASDEKTTESTPAPSATTSTPTPTPTPAPAPTTPAPTPTSPTGACTPFAAPSACTALDNGALCTGVARCMPNADNTTGTWGPCECGVIPVPITTTNDCVTVSCPATAPNVVGCSLTFTGSDGRGCVAHSAATPSSVFLKEGNKCSSGNIGGVLFCSATPATAPLDATTCPMTAKTKLYVAAPNNCPS